MSEFEMAADGAAAVDRDYHWRPMSTCPRSTKVQLLGRGGIAVYASWDGSASYWWLGWAPLPTRPEWMRVSGQEAA